MSRETIANALIEDECVAGRAHGEPTSGLTSTCSSGTLLRMALRALAGILLASGLAVLAAAGAPITLAIADEARQRLGRTRSAEQRRRLDEALDAATRTLDSGGTGSPGLVELGRASLLAALGRDDESRRSWRKVFLYPDRNLSHALARAWFPPVEARR